MQASLFHPPRYTAFVIPGASKPGQRDVIPHFDTIVRIAELLDISLDELVKRSRVSRVMAEL